MTDVVQRAEVRMVQARDCPSFAIESFAAPRIIFGTCPKHLDRDNSLEPRITGPIHFAHAAGAEGRLNFVRAKERARGDCQVQVGGL
jgi:hypothetical protein